MNWNCAQTEERLSDYLDGLLSAGERAEFEAHAAGCARCAQLVAQVGGMVRRVQSLEPIEAPARLVSAILDQTLGPRAPKHGWRSWLAWAPSLLQPRFAIGMATAAASLLILLYAAGLNPAKIHKGDLNPVNIYRSMNRQSHLVYARGVKYVNDLRVVYEIQSRLRPPDSPAREEQPPAQPPSVQPEQKSQGSPHPGRSSNRSSSLYAFVVAQTFVRSSP
jgi:anti-sigma factor RsiW